MSPSQQSAAVEASFDVLEQPKLPKPQQNVMLDTGAHIVPGPDDEEESGTPEWLK